MKKIIKLVNILTSKHPGKGSYVHILFANYCTYFMNDFSTQDDQLNQYIMDYQKYNIIDTRELVVFLDTYFYHPILNIIKHVVTVTLDPKWNPIITKSKIKSYGLGYKILLCHAFKEYYNKPEKIENNIIDMVSLKSCLKDFVKIHNISLEETNAIETINMFDDVYKVMNEVIQKLTNSVNGGSTLCRTDEKRKVGGREHVVYVGPTGKNSSSPKVKWWQFVNFYTLEGKNILQ